MAYEKTDLHTVMSLRAFTVCLVQTKRDRGKRMLSFFVEHDLGKPHLPHTKGKEYHGQQSNVSRLQQSRGERQGYPHRLC